MSARPLPIAVAIAQLRKVLTEPVDYSDLLSQIATGTPPSDDHLFDFSCGLTLLITRGMRLAQDCVVVTAASRRGDVPLTVRHVCKHLQAMGFNPRIPVAGVSVDGPVLDLDFEAVEGEPWFIETAPPAATTPSGVN